MAADEKGGEKKEKPAHFSVTFAQRCQDQVRPGRVVVRGGRAAGERHALDQRSEKGTSAWAELFRLIGTKREKKSDFRVL